ncbi:hypothetical protein CC2G_006812 [Coprinopsis cinerea AmutBmut pab1-1]|nr:hypothetical protein CC2G_006812 [Coprinopsis cinerea AmutBmut pab1-1]
MNGQATTTAGYAPTGSAPLASNHHHSQSAIFSMPDPVTYNVNGSPNPNANANANGAPAPVSYAEGGGFQGGNIGVGRTTSVRSRTPSRPGSSLSKSQSLIKKNIELQDLKPADVLIERFVAWKAIVKQLCMYFEGIADIENNTAKEMMKLAGVIQVPFKSGNQFLGEGGLQDVYYAIRDKTRSIADQHANLGRTIDSSIVQHLQKLLAEIKAHIRNIQNDTGKLASSVASSRLTSTHLIGSLANSISTYKNTPLSLPARSDPYLLNTAVRHQLSRQILEENLLQKSIVIMQQNSAAFEEGIVRSVKGAWETFDEWMSRRREGGGEVYRVLAEHMRELKPDREWIAFAARSDHLVHPETPLRDPSLVSYPLKDDPSTIPIHSGHLERRTGGFMGKSWREGYYVLTPAGYLHEFSTSDESLPAGQVPVWSLFLPVCTLGPASGAGASAHTFVIEARPLSTSSSSPSYSGSKSPGKAKLKALLTGQPASSTGFNSSSALTSSSTSPLKNQGATSSGKTYTFRTRSHESKMEWWNDLRMLCARYLVASEVVRRVGPVESAVRGVGYREEDLVSEEEELEDVEVYEEGYGEGGVYGEEGEGGYEGYMREGGYEVRQGGGYGMRQGGYEGEGLPVEETGPVRGDTQGYGAPSNAYAYQGGGAYTTHYQAPSSQGYQQPTSQAYQQQPTTTTYQQPTTTTQYQQPTTTTTQSYQGRSGGGYEGVGAYRAHRDRDGEEEHEGSSVEEEVGEEEEEPPVYSRGSRDVGGAVGGNGYPVDKKSYQFDDSNAPAPVPVPSYADHVTYEEKQGSKTKVKKRGSKRQMEKAPAVAGE